MLYLQIIQLNNIKIKNIVYELIIYTNIIRYLIYTLKYMCNYFLKFPTQINR